MARSIGMDDGGRPFERVLLGAALGLSALLLVWGVVLGRRVGAVEGKASSLRSGLAKTTRGVEEVASVRGDVRDLTDKTRALERAEARVESALKELRAEVSAMSRARSEPAGLSAVRGKVEEIATSQDRLAGEVKRIDKALKERPPAPSAEQAAGEESASAEQVRRNEKRIDTAEKDIEDLKKAKSVRVNEKALRETVNKMVEEEMERLRDQWFKRMREGRGRRER